MSIYPFLVFAHILGSFGIGKNIGKRETGGGSREQREAFLGRLSGGQQSRAAAFALHPLQISGGDIETDGAKNEQRPNQASLSFVTHSVVCRFSAIL